MIIGKHQTLDPALDSQFAVISTSITLITPNSFPAKHPRGGSVSPVHLIKYTVDSKRPFVVEPLLHPFWNL